MLQQQQSSSLAPPNRFFLAYMRTPLSAIADPASVSNAPSGSEWRDLLWIALIVIPTVAVLAHSAQ